MMRRLDEVLCSKTDKTVVRDLRDDVAATYLTKADSNASVGMVTEKISDFSKRVEEVEELMKFQSRQL